MYSCASCCWYPASACPTVSGLNIYVIAEAYLSCKPATHEHIDSTKPFCLVDGVELHEHAVQGAADTRVPLAVRRLVPLREVVIPYEWVM